MDEIDARALDLLRRKRLSANGLAVALGVSLRTAARVVARIKKRRRIVAVREGHGWYYEVQGRRPGRAPLLDLIGFVRTDLTDGAENHDKYIYGDE